MKSKERHRVKRLRLDAVVWGLIFMLLGCFLVASQAEAALTAQALNGTVEVLLAGEQNWKPLTAAMQLKASDQIRTGPNSAVDLLLEDGSVLNLSENTELAISQLDISTELKTRVARFKLGWGAVTAKLTKLAFTESTCEVETDTVVAGVKFSEMTVSSPQNSPQAEVIGREGLLEVTRLSEQRTVKVSGLLDEKHGIAFSLPALQNIRVLIGVYKIVSKVTVQSSGLLPDIRLLLDNANDLMKIDNTSKTPLQVKVKKAMAVLGQQGSATFGFPAGQEATINTDNAAFSIKQRGPVEDNGALYVFLNAGSLTVNGKPAAVGIPNYFPLEGGPQPAGKSRALIQQPGEGTKEEQPVAPNSPQAQTSGSSGVQLTPTPTPTPKPTPTPTPRPSPTPTPTPGLTPTPTPTPASEPQSPPPPPIQTPASPSKLVPK